MTTVQRFAMVAALVLLGVFAVFVVVNLVSSQSLPIWAVVAIVAFFASLIVFPLIRRRQAHPRDSAADRKDPK